MPLDFVADVSRPPRSLRELEGVADDPGHADAREHRLLDGHLVGEAAVEPAADLAVLALDVLAYDDQVQPVAAAHRAVDAGERPGRPHVGELAERAPDRDQQPPQRHVVGHARPADRAEQDRVVRRGACRSRRRASSRRSRRTAGTTSRSRRTPAIRSYAGATASRTDRATAVTSWPDPVARDDRDPVADHQGGTGLAEAEDRDQQRQEDQDQDRADDVEADPRPDHLGDRHGAGAVDDRRSAASTPAA